MFKVAINGFGRIGRMFCRIASDHADIDLVAINASYNSSTLAHLLRYDTVHGRFEGKVEAEPDHLIVNGRSIRLLTDRDPANLPWAQMGVDLVVEATGQFRHRAGAERHLQAGARKVLITAPARGADLTMVVGVNDHLYDPAIHHIVSGASCTTNALAPVAKVLNETFGIVSGLVTTIHSYTNDQNLVDNPHQDLRRARGAALAIVPTTTGAAKAVALVLPELAGRLNGLAMRVPTPDVSVIDLTARLKAKASSGAVNLALQQAAQGGLSHVLGYIDEPLVSADFTGDSRSAIIDACSTMTGPDNLVKVIAWYDNEWGYASRLADLAAHMCRAAQGAHTLASYAD